MSGASPTQKTLALLRERGWECAVVEKFVGPLRIRQDAYGWMDILCIDPVRGAVGVQSCGQAFSEHVHKLIEERGDILKKWVDHHPAELIGWRKKKAVLADGSKGKADRWCPRIADIVLDPVTGELQIVERKETRSEQAKPV